MTFISLKDFKMDNMDHDDFKMDNMDHDESIGEREQTMHLL